MLPVLLAAALQSASLAASPSPVAPTAVLPALTPWGSYEEAYRCTVERTFGARPAGTFALKLGYSPFRRPDDADFLVRLARQPPIGQPIRVSFDGGPTLTVEGRVLWFATRKVALIHSDHLSNDFWQAFRDARAMSIAVGDVTVATVALPAAEKVAAAAESCARKLYEGWGGTPAMAQAASWPRLTKRWIFDGDYPLDASLRGVGGRVFMRYQVGADGRVRDCTVLRSSRSKVLDTTSCQLLTKRAQFTPARAADGSAMPMITGMWVRWQVLDSDLLDDIFVGGFIGAGQPAGIAN